MSMKIIFMDHNAPMCKCWSKDLKTLTDLAKLELKWNKQFITFSIQNAKLQDLKIDNQYGRTAIVSPGNSLGYLGGGMDRYIGEIFSPNKNHKDTEKLIQYDLNNGYRPPGTVKLVTIPDEKLRRSIAFERLAANTIIHAPTMRTPVNLIQDQGAHAYRLIFDITWQILTEVDAYNRQLGKNTNDRIETIVLPGLGTGYGKVSYEMASKSMLAAIGIFTASLLTDAQRAVLALRYLGYKHYTLLPTPDKIPSTTFDLEKDDLIDLFQFNFFNMKSFLVSSNSES